VNRCIVHLLCMALATACTVAAAQTTTFNYQGRLTDGGSPATGDFQMQFRLFDSIGGANQFGPTLVDLPVTATLGNFSVNLDFGSHVLAGGDRWLEIAVRRNAGESYVTLSPREQILSTPYAIRALEAVTAGSANDAAQLGGIPATSYLLTDGDGSNLQNLSAANINGTIAATQLSPEAQPTTASLKLLGSLRWDLLKIHKTFAVGTNPVAVAFDGANVWVVNNGSENVTKIRVGDGAVLGTFAVGGLPTAIAFDGANMWVANSGSNNVTKLRASDGANLGTFPAGSAPQAVAFDGTNLWVVNDLGGPVNGTVTKLRASDGANIGTVPISIAPVSIAFDGANMWVGHASGSVVRLRAAGDGVNPGSPLSIPGARGLAFDGTYMWVASSSGNLVARIRPGTQPAAPIDTFAVGASPQSTAFDGANIWVSDGSGLTKLRAKDGVNLGTFAIGSNPRGMAFDGSNIWVAIRDGAAVTRISPEFPQ